MRIWPVEHESSRRPRSSAGHVLARWKRVPLSRYVLFAVTARVGLRGRSRRRRPGVLRRRDLRAGEIYWLWTGHVGIQLSRNLGALFGIGQGKVWLFAALEHRRA